MPPAPIDESTWQALGAAAEEASGHAYAPYSRFGVGAAVLTSDGKVFAGCNVENVSYGLTICAERNAVFSAVTASDRRPELVAIYITSDPPMVAPPCGACRQALAEFGNPQVSFIGEKGRCTMPLAELLPVPFVSRPTPPT